MQDDFANRGTIANCSAVMEEAFEFCHGTADKARKSEASSVLKYIIIASFGLTGSLFYLSRPKGMEQKALSANIAEPEAEFSKSVPSRKKILSSTSLPVVPTESPKYAALLPIGDQAAPAMPVRSQRREDFSQKYVHVTVRSCYNELVKRRLHIHKELEGDAELSFNGDLQIIATFTQNQVESLRSRSSEIRDETFHNCIENGAKSWNFPEYIVSQGQWTYKQRLSFDVNYRFTCLDPTFQVGVVGGSPVVGTRSCL